MDTICCPVDCGTACKLPEKPPGSGKLITRRSEEQDNTTMLFLYNYSRNKGSFHTHFRVWVISHCDFDCEMYSSNKSMFLYFTTFSALKQEILFCFCTYTSRHYIKDAESRILSMTNETRNWNNFIVISMYEGSFITHKLHP